jgi:hypothetical protein
MDRELDGIRELLVQIERDGKNAYARGGDGKEW